MPRKITMTTGLRFVQTKAETGKVYRRWRKERNLTKSAFSRLLALSPSAYHYIETGKYYPSYETIAITRGLGYDITLLLDVDSAKGVK
jgi:transcriptional regulator with XRE-family HTH domain